MHRYQLFNCHSLERKVEAIGKRIKLSIVGGNWEGIIGDRLSIIIIIA